MRDRVALTAQPTGPCPGRHCWVLSGAGDLDVGQRRPALLVEWRQTRGTWEGRVVYLSEVAPGRWVLTEEWMPAALLTPS